MHPHASSCIPRHVVPRPPPPLTRVRVTLLDPSPLQADLLPATRPRNAAKGSETRGEMLAKAMARLEGLLAQPEYKDDPDGLLMRVCTRRPANVRTRKSRTDAAGEHNATRCYLLQIGAADSV